MTACVFVINRRIYVCCTLDRDVCFFTGFWLGLLVCVIIQSNFYIIVIFKLNWKKITDEVRYWLSLLACWAAAV